MSWRRKVVFRKQVVKIIKEYTADNEKCKVGEKER